MSKSLDRSIPLSIRLSGAERESLVARAGAMPVSSYVKTILFDRERPKEAPRQKLADRILLAHLLATLGSSNIAANLHVLAEAAKTGSLVADPEVVARLEGACDDVRLMHNALMRGLGKRERSPSAHELRARKAFNDASGANDEDPQ